MRAEYMPGAGSIRVAGFGGQANAFHEQPGVVQHAPRAAVIGFIAVHLRRSIHLKNKTAQKYSDYVWVSPVTFDRTASRVRACVCWSGKYQVFRGESQIAVTRALLRAGSDAYPIRQRLCRSKRPLHTHHRTRPHRRDFAIRAYNLGDRQI